MEDVAVENDEEKSLNCSLLILPNNTLCIEDPEEMLLPWKAHPYFFEIIFLHAIIFVFGFLGNLMVIAVMTGDRKSRNATNFFLVSLAVGDLLMLCVYGPLETYTHFVIKWDENGAVCKTAQFAEMVSATSSVLNLLAVTVERFIVIVFPMKSQIFCTVSNMVKAVLSVWVLSLFLAFPVIFTTYTYKMTFTNNVTTLTLNYCSRSDDSPNFVVYQFFIIFCVPSITMTICYSFVIRELWVSTKKMNLLTNGVSFRNKSSRTQFSLIKRNAEKAKGDEGYAMVDMKLPRKNFHHNNNRSVVSRSLKRSLQNSQRDASKEVFLAENNSSPNNEVNQARKQVIKMLILVIILFYVCWGPRVSMDVLQKYELVKFNNKAYTMRIAFNIMTFFHACINPFIYSFMSKNFRARLIKYLEKCGLKKKKKWQRRNNQTISGSVKSYPKYYNGRSDFDEKRGHARITGQGSFISCETKISELDSVTQQHFAGNSC